MSTTSDRPIEIREQDGKLYASSPQQGWYLVSLGDEQFPWSCECAHFRFRLAGKSEHLCKHLEAAAAYVAERHKPRCPCCGQAVPEPIAKREPILTDEEMMSLWR